MRHTETAGGKCASLLGASRFHAARDLTGRRAYRPIPLLRAVGRCSVFPFKIFGHTESPNPPQISPPPLTRKRREDGPSCSPKNRHMRITPSRRRSIPRMALPGRPPVFGGGKMRGASLYHLDCGAAMRSIAQRARGRTHLLEDDQAERREPFVSDSAPRTGAILKTDAGSRPEETLSRTHTRGRRKGRMPRAS